MLNNTTNTMLSVCYVILLVFVLLCRDEYSRQGFVRRVRVLHHRVLAVLYFLGAVGCYALAAILLVAVNLFCLLVGLPVDWRMDKDA